MPEMNGRQLVRALQSTYPATKIICMSGYAEDELTGQDAGRLLLAGYRRIGDLALLPLYGGVSAEYGNVWQTGEELGFSDGILAGSLWVGADTPLGPVYLAYGRAEGGQSAIYLLVGRIF